MPYIPYEHEIYKSIKEVQKKKMQFFEYPVEMLNQVNSILPEGEDLIPYGYESLDSYCEEMEKWLEYFSNDKEKYELINRYYYKIVILNLPEAWAIVKYIGESSDEVMGLTKGKYYYCPRPLNNHETFGVIDDEWFTSYMYSCDPDLWELYEDPTGEASKTLNQKPRVNRMCRCCGKHYFFYSDEVCPICGWEHVYQDRKTLKSFNPDKSVLIRCQQNILKSQIDMNSIVHFAFESLMSDQIDYICLEYGIFKKELFEMTERQLDCVYNTLNKFREFEEYANGRGTERYKILLSIIRSIEGYYKSNLWVHLWQMPRFSHIEAIKAHEFCNNNKPELEVEQKCGCFYCQEIFDSSEITEWLIDDNPADKHGTAVCPKCGIDSVIGECTGYPITEKFLEKMNEIWFDVYDSDLDDFE